MQRSTSTHRRANNLEVYPEDQYPQMDIEHRYKETVEIWEKVDDNFNGDAPNQNAHLIPQMILGNSRIANSFEDRNQEFIQEQINQTGQDEYDDGDHDYQLIENWNYDYQHYGQTPHEDYLEYPDNELNRDAFWLAQYQNKHPQENENVHYNDDVMLIQKKYENHHEVHVYENGRAFEMCSHKHEEFVQYNDNGFVVRNGAERSTTVQVRDEHDVHSYGGQFNRIPVGIHHHYEEQKEYPNYQEVYVDENDHASEMYSYEHESFVNNDDIVVVEQNDPEDRVQRQSTVDQNRIVQLRKSSKGTRNTGKKQRCGDGGHQNRKREYRHADNKKQRASEAVHQNQKHATQRHPEKISNHSVSKFPPPFSQKPYLTGNQQIRQLVENKESVRNPHGRIVLQSTKRKLPTVSSLDPSKKKKIAKLQRWTTLSKGALAIPEQWAKRPPIDYTSLCIYACLNSPTGEVNEFQIVSFILHHWAYYRFASIRWKLSVRAKLQIDSVFLTRLEKRETKNVPYYSLIDEKAARLHLATQPSASLAEMEFQEHLAAGLVGLPRLLFYHVIGECAPRYAGAENSALFYHLISVGKLPEKFSDKFRVQYEQCRLEEPKYVEEQMIYHKETLKELDDLPSFGVNKDHEVNRKMLEVFRFNLNDYFDLQKRAKEENLANWMTPSIKHICSMSTYD